MEALIRIQKELKVKKERWNEFGQFPYRNAEDILKAVKPLLQSETLITTTELKLLGDDVYFGSTAILRSGEHSACATAWAREEKIRPKMGPGQLSGAAESYAKKYALGDLFMLDDGFDADHPTLTKPPTGPADWTPTTGPAQPPPAATAPAEQPPPVAPPQVQIPAPSPDQRRWLKALWDYYVANSQGKLQPVDAKSMQKLMSLCQMHMHRYPGSMNDVEQLKQWIKVEELYA